MNWQSVQRYQPQVLSILRIMAGLLILQFGMAKILGIPADPRFAGVQLFSLIGLAGTLELIGGALLTIGLFTRATAFILSGEMAAAYFIGHFGKGFIPLLNGGNEAVIYCFVFLYLFVAGGGPWSVDAMREGPLAKSMT